MQVMIDTCRTNGIEVVHLEVSPDHAAAISYYEEFGFSRRDLTMSRGCFVRPNANPSCISRVIINGQTIVYLERVLDAVGKTYRKVIAEHFSNNFRDASQIVETELSRRQDLNSLFAITMQVLTLPM